jgi:cyclopropane-fatty-acyl-phospholipid synthase
MTQKVLPKATSLSRYITSLPLLDQIAKSALCKLFKNLKYGTLTIIDGQETLVFGDDGPIKVRVTVHSSSFYSRTLFGGSIGNTESFVDGDWDCSNLTDLVRLFVKNRALTQQLDGALTNLTSPLQKIFHGFRANTLEGSRENIRSHYDMGNKFFELFLDPTMMYSSAIFDSPATALEDASITKIKTICDKLELKSEDHLVEIGTGWGSLAIYAAQNYGCKVTTTTISEQQHAYTLAKVKSLGLEGQIQVLFEDYRKLQGSYDKLVSVEMIEAVGLNNLDTYFEVCSRLLKPDGIMVLQAITIRDQYYENAKKSVDFIQRHIFPGSGIPSVNAIMNSVTKKTDMVMVNQQDYAEDYAQTLLHWSKRFESKVQDILDLGYPHFLPRLWKYYFSYCEGGFRERAIGLSQIILTKPDYRNRSLS